MTDLTRAGTAAGAPRLQLPAYTVGGPTPWTGVEKPAHDNGFSLLVLGDRTGLARPGVFERGIAAANLIAPDLVLMVGDMVEGYSTDRAAIEAEWAEIEDMVAPLQMPFFRTAGNHDISNPVMGQVWRERFGPSYYAFRYADVLVVVLDTQDPPPPAPENVDALLSGMDRLRELQERDPVDLARQVEALQDWESTMPAAISDEQAAWAEQVIADNADVRWTVVAMHMPAWQGEEHPGLAQVRRALGGRGYTMLAGHAHNYERRVIDGRDHLRLGPTGGAFSLVRDEGQFDMVTLLRFSGRPGEGPSIANLALDGIFGVEGGVFEPRSWREPTT